MFLMACSCFSWPASLCRGQGHEPEQTIVKDLDKMRLSCVEG